MKYNYGALWKDVLLRSYLESIQRIAPEQQEKMFLAEKGRGKEEFLQTGRWRTGKEQQCVMGNLTWLKPGMQAKL